MVTATSRCRAAQSAAPSPAARACRQKAASPRVGGRGSACLSHPGIDRSARYGSGSSAWAANALGPAARATDGLHRPSALQECWTLRSTTRASCRRNTPPDLPRDADDHIDTGLTGPAAQGPGETSRTPGRLRPETERRISGVGTGGAALNRAMAAQRGHDQLWFASLRSRDVDAPLFDAVERALV